MRTNDLPFFPSDTIAIPGYLSQTYWWAYVHPKAVRFFERQWLVNLILWGNFGRLRDAALEALGERLEGRTLQIACVYGDLTNRLRSRLTPGGSLDVVDVLRVQLDYLARKLPGDPRVGLIQGDSAALDIPSQSYDRRAAVLPAARATRGSAAQDARRSAARAQARRPAGHRRLPPPA